MTDTKTALTRTPLAATQIVNGLAKAERLANSDGSGSPVHPALAILDWGSTRTDVHGIACSTMGRETDDGPVLYHFECHCGFKTAKHETEADATVELIEHALSTCAVCQGPKDLGGNFPRCSNCAF
jgi:hypothetical protein